MDLDYECNSFDSVKGETGVNLVHILTYYVSYIPPVTVDAAQGYKYQTLYPIGFVTKL